MAAPEEHLKRLIRLANGADDSFATSAHRQLLRARVNANYLADEVPCTMLCLLTCDLVTPRMVTQLMRVCPLQSSFDWP
jgi:hypothetical protein